MGKCDNYEADLPLEDAWAWIDMVISSFAPFIIMAVSAVAIVLRVIYANVQHQRNM